MTISITNRSNTVCKARRQPSMLQHYGQTKTSKVVPFPKTIGNVSHLNTRIAVAKVRFKAIPVTAGLIKFKVRPLHHNKPLHQEALGHLFLVSVAYQEMAYIVLRIVLVSKSVTSATIGLTQTMNVGGKIIEARTNLIVISIQE